MNSVSETGNGGIFRLSGRRNIHDHGTDCPFWNGETMGRYGLGTNQRQERGVCTQEGTDEVDNVMSKMARASSPITTRKRDYHRRNSFDSPDQPKHNYTNDSDEDSNLLSKSSPAILSQYSFCSEEAEGRSNINYSYESANSSSSQSRLNASRNSVHNTSSKNPRVIERNINKTNLNQSTKKGSIKMVLVPSIIAVISLVAYYMLFIKKEEISNVIYDKYSFYNDVKGVGNKYKASDNSILQVRAGIATIFEREDTGSFIFAYNSGRSDFNLVDFNNFVNEIASVAAKYLRNHTRITRHVVVDTSNLRVQSDKELMNKYVDEVAKTGVMLVKDLDVLPSTVAKAFHYYCDEFNPLVKKSAIFFTLNMAKCSNVSREKYTHENVEKCLAEKWVKMPQDNLRPLLSRVVSVVIDVTQ